MTMIKMILGVFAEPGQHQYWMPEKPESLHDRYFGLLKMISVVFLSWRRRSHLSAAFVFPNGQITSEKQTARRRGEVVSTLRHTAVELQGH